MEMRTCTSIGIRPAITYLNVDSLNDFQELKYISYKMEWSLHKTQGDEIGEMCLKRIAKTKASST